MTEPAPTYKTNGNGDSFAEFDKPTLKVRAGQYDAGVRFHIMFEWTSSKTTPDAFLNALILAAHEARPLLES